jgi:hypothetical protein
VEQPEGLHCIERGSFLGLCMLKGNRSGKLVLLCGWENCERLIFVCVCYSQPRAHIYGSIALPQG